MTKKQLSLLISGLLLLLLIFFFLQHTARLKKKEVDTNNEELIYQLEKIRQRNQFPLSSSNDYYSLACLVEDIIINHNYEATPILAGDWRSLVDIKCAYFDSNYQKQWLYLPLTLYQESTLTEYTIRTQAQQQIKSRVLTLLESINIDYYNRIFKQFYHIDFKPGYILLLNISYPTQGMSQEDTNGTAFETLLEKNAPYQASDLSNFYQTGQPNFLPKINGHYYFWPIASYGLINALN